MRKLLILGICLCGFLFSGLTVSAAQTPAPELSSYYDALSKAFAWQCSYRESAGVQDWLDHYASDHTDSGNVQSYVIALLGSTGSQFDYSHFETALQAQLSDSLLLQDEVSVPLSPATMQKSLLVLEGIAATQHHDLAASPSVLSSILSDTIRAKGIMTYVYGFLMLDGDALDSPAYSREELLDLLLSLQLPDGGFCVTGDEGDVDVTAMVLQALAPYSSLPDVSDCIHRSLNFLESARLSTGDFASYGNRNSESVSQVLLSLMALSSYEKDPEQEEIFTNSALIDEIPSLMEVLLSYQNEDGGFAHTPGGLSNDMATSQAAYVLAAYTRYAKSNCFLFDYSEYAPTPYDAGSAAVLRETVADKSDFDYRIPVTLALLLLLLAGSAAVIIVSLKKEGTLSKKGKQQILSLTLVVGILLFILWVFHIETKETYSSISTTAGNTISVTFSIEKRTIDEPDIYAPTLCLLEEGSSVFDLLMEVCRREDIQVEYTGTPSHGSTYVEGIDYLYEFDHGDLSGWMYLVNGEFPSVGCGDYYPGEGDVIRFVYTTNIGKDVNTND